MEYALGYGWSIKSEYIYMNFRSRLLRFAGHDLVLRSADVREPCARELVRPHLQVGSELQVLLINRRSVTEANIADAMLRSVDNRNCWAQASPECNQTAAARSLRTGQLESASRNPNSPCPHQTAVVGKIAKRFGANPGTVQRISRPFAGASVAAP